MGNSGLILMEEANFGPSVSQELLVPFVSQLLNMGYIPQGVAAPGSDPLKGRQQFSWVKDSLSC